MDLDENAGVAAGVAGPDAIEDELAENAAHVAEHEDLGAVLDNALALMGVPVDIDAFFLDPNNPDLDNWVNDFIQENFP
jgi:hypothetical protein